MRKYKVDKKHELCRALAASQYALHFSGNLCKALYFVNVKETLYC